MANKTRELINMMLKVQEKLALLYKNVASIDGQYNLNLKSAAKVMSELMRKRHDAYQAMLYEAAYSSDEATDEGYETIRRAIKKLSESLSQESFSDVHSFIIYTIKHTEKIITIAVLAIERIDANDLNQDEIRNCLEEIIVLEKETKSTLESFKGNEK